MTAQPILLLGTGCSVKNSNSFKQVLEFDVTGDNQNVFVHFEDVPSVVPSNIKPRMRDLLEIAAYIYSADCAVSRGLGWADREGTLEKWGRKFKAILPVRDLNFWRKDEIKASLKKIIGFLANDEYDFDFVKLSKEPDQQLFFDIAKQDAFPVNGAERVILFSGGLDSLAGAVESAARGENLVLVSHRPVSTLDKRQRDLVVELKKMFPSVQIVHIPVWVNKKATSREATQRTRSFLFAALGALVADSINVSSVRFFENGIVSLNLPVAEEVLQSRASRTTHPISLQLFSKLFSKILERDFTFDNPYIYATKSEVVQKLSNCGASRIIYLSRSCSHTIYQSKNQWHCGACSQCIDRRIAILAAGQGEFDSANDYVTDVFIGERKKGYEIGMAINYAKNAQLLSKMDENEIAAKFGLELARAARPFSDVSKACNEFIDMHKRFGKAAFNVIGAQVRENAQELISGELPDSSMVSLISRLDHLEPVVSRFANRVSEILKVAIPIACNPKRPANEPELQQLVAATLTSSEAVFVTEFPFMRWSSTLTKPDLSTLLPQELWIEVKYVRPSQGLVKITDAIAADITKYGANNGRVLFAVYDPDRQIKKDSDFIEDIEKHTNMFVSLIR